MVVLRRGNDIATGRKGIGYLLALAFLLAAEAYGQEPQPRLEVASIKLGGTVLSPRPQRSPGRLRWTTQLAYLIGYAYDLDFSRVSGPPLGSVYTIEAVFDAAATEDQLRIMLQALLADRFKMRFHRINAEVN